PFPYPTLFRSPSSSTATASRSQKRNITRLPNSRSRPLNIRGLTGSARRDAGAMYEILLNIIAPVVGTAGLGYFWARTGRVFHTETVTAIVTNIGAPMLIFSTLAGLEMALGSFLEFAFLAFLAAVLFGAVGLLVLWLCRLDIRDYLPGIMFPNVGNMGLPLCMFAFGEAGLALGIAFFTVFSTLQFTVGIWLSSGTTSLAQLLRTPLIYAVVIGLGVKALGI